MDCMSFNLGSGRLSAEINVTPLIDVLLVLLIVFMIITPVEPRGLFANIPQQGGNASSTDSAVVLQLSENPGGTPSLAINHQELAWDNLRNRLLEIYKARADGVLFIKGESDVEFEYVARAIDVAHGANVTRVGLIP